MRLRAKILTGFLILAAMLLVAGAWSIYELRNISTSVQKLLDENYRSIDAAKSMLEALEREDSAILLLLLGKREEGREILQSADGSFEEAYLRVSRNVTIPGEQVYVDKIKNAYGQYKRLWKKPIVETEREGNLNWYRTEVHPVFLDTKLAVQNLMTLNDTTMYQTASELETRARRATMPGIIAIVSFCDLAIKSPTEVASFASSSSVSTCTSKGIPESRFFWMPCVMRIMSVTTNRLIK